MQTKIILTIAIISVSLIINIIVTKYLLKFSQKNEMGKTRKKKANRILRTINLIVTVFLLITIWGIDFVENILITITSVIALIAIGFVAVWSMLSNILASLIIFFTKPFKIGDEIKIIPDEVSGKVVSIGYIFTTLRRDDEIINIPNNQIMQKAIIKKIKQK